MVVAVVYGRLTVLRLIRGVTPAIEFQKSFRRAGHALAGVLVVFAIVAQLWRTPPTYTASPTSLRGTGSGWPRSCSHRLSCPRRDRHADPLLLLQYLGAASLTAGVLTRGIGLVTAGPAATALLRWVVDAAPGH